ncbi:uncharacterized protein LOC133283555 [Gastrolobium bilobum]|uniref:uncharacterized protein LOC133283555 n=1 Tax=Gastrolobium bilobum TaxID=150636 RepID=UPI002AB07B9C|nr:uncharacterized protein LOC133283555 [Gastrolobium bilobum]
MESSNQFHDSFKQGLLAGYIFAATFVIVFYMSYCIPIQLFKKRKRNKGKCKSPHQGLKQDNIKEKRKKARQIGKPLPVELLDKRIQINEVGRFTCRMSFTKLCTATNYFSMENAIGAGRIGIMYKAMLPNGWFLAIKRLYDSQLLNKQFELEIMILGRYNHRNIVPLHGFCKDEEGNERILVYQYMSNGRLSDWLRDDVTRLGWPVVIRIALGVARGLCCLHHSLHMVHHSISSECILLENNFEPRISNFGEAMFLNHDIGTNGGCKEDVYNFGILLFELIRGRKFGDISDSFSNTNCPFATFTYPNPTNLLENPCGFYDDMDKYLNEIEFEDEVSALVRVACDCVHPFPDQRPTMLNVYSKMSHIWERDGICEDSFTYYQMHELLPLQLVEKGSKEISVLLESLTSTILFEELHDATDCFAMDNAIGVGKMGIMYKGKLPNGQFLAVKRLLSDSQLFNRQFLSEIMIQGKYRHRNIMPLLGFCMERNEKILVYQYMSNGRLSKWLHPVGSEVMILKWLERVDIAIGIARGLSWLHHSCNLQIVHLNICSECILLDEKFEPKISNFGEAKFMNPNTDDDFGMIFKVNDGKKDVYDFGSVLFELITGKTYNELSCSFSTTNLCGNPSSFYNAIDKSLAGEGFVNEVCTLLKVACECVRPFPDQRPTMLEVYNNMSNIWKGRHGFNDEFDMPRGSEIVSVTSIDEIV